MRFIVTKELGRLSKWLRILGFDTEYFTEDKEVSLIIRALQEDKIILTRNTHWGKHLGIKKLHIQSDSVYAQLQQVVRELPLVLDKSRMFTRCVLCNEALEAVEKERVKDRVPEYVFTTHENFVICAHCQRIYWQGSHWGNVEKILKEIQVSV